MTVGGDERFDPQRPDERPAPGPGGDRLLIVTADDYGLTEGVSRAILDAHRHGVVTATSVLANAPATASSLPWLADHPDLEAGLHVALVGEDPPVSPARAIPTLVDRRGRLAASWRTLLPRLAARRVDPADLRTEIEAQLATLTEAGVPVHHLNAHQHLHLWPSVGAALRDVALTHGIGFVRTPRAAGSAARARGIARLAAALAADLTRHDLASTDGFLGLTEAGHMCTSVLVGGLHRPPTHGSLEVNLHPGPTADPALGRYRWGYDWSGDLAAACDPGTRRAITEGRFRLVAPSLVPRPAH